jgi:hypothetical protein
MTNPKPLDLDALQALCETVPVLIARVRELDALNTRHREEMEHWRDRAHKAEAAVALSEQVRVLADDNVRLLEIRSARFAREAFDLRARVTDLEAALVAAIDGKERK